MKAKTQTQEVPRDDLWYSDYSLVPVALAAISSNIKKKLLTISIMEIVQYIETLFRDRYNWDI